MDHGLHHFAHVFLIAVERQELLPSGGWYMIENLEVCHSDIDRALYFTTVRWMYQEIDRDSFELKPKFVGCTALKTKSFLSEPSLAANVGLAGLGYASGGITLCLTGNFISLIYQVADRMAKLGRLTS